MPDLLTPTDPDLHATRALACGDPGLISAMLLHAIQGLDLARMMLRKEPVRNAQGRTLAHLLRAQEELQQAVRAWMLPDEIPRPRAVTLEIQATLDTVLAARELPQR